MPDRITRPIILAGLALVILLGPGAVRAQAQDEAGSEAILYERLGGYDVIAAAIDDFLGRFGGDPELAPGLAGLNAAAGARVRQHLVDFICARTGGPCLYLGRDMESTHEGLGITDAHFDRVIGHFHAAFAAAGAPEKAVSELRTMLEGLRDEVVAARTPQ